MSHFPEYPQPSPDTVRVIGIGFAPQRTRQLLPPVVQPVEETIKAGRVDIDIHAALTNRRNLPEGESKNSTLEFELGGYAIAVQITVERLAQQNEEATA